MSLLHSVIWIFLMQWLCAEQPVTTKPGVVGLKSQAPFSITEVVDTLPVVVHVIHTGGAVGTMSNPSDSLIQALIGLMNNAYRKNGLFYGGADLQIQFELARVSPECESTSGIIRVDGSVLDGYVDQGITGDTFFYPASVHEVFVKGLSRWPNTDYINIWIVNKIDGSAFQPGGYAYFPEYNNALTDGIVLQASVIDGFNKTVVHELGHYFNLFHVFEDEDWQTECSENNDCSTEGDMICDTEPCVFTTNCNEPMNTCTGDDWMVADPMFGYTVLNNYMGYTDCEWMFTEDQKDRVREALYEYRPGLLNSGALNEVPLQSPVTACIPDAANALSPYFGIERVQFGILDVYSNTSGADGASYIDRSCNQQVRIHAGDTVLVRITGSYENYQYIRVYIDFDENGSFEIPEELILAEEGGVVEDTFVIPAIALYHTLRVRVIAENPSAAAPLACHLEGTIEEGVGQIEDFGLVIEPRMVHSISSGEWFEPSTWSCNCVPEVTDIVIILNGHSVDAQATLDTIRCAGLQMDPGAQLDVDGAVRIVKILY